MATFGSVHLSSRPLNQLLVEPQNQFKISLKLSSIYYICDTYLCCLIANQAFTHSQLMKCYIILTNLFWLFKQLLLLGHNCVSPKWK